VSQCENYILPSSLLEKPSEAELMGLNMKEFVSMQRVQKHNLLASEIAKNKLGEITAKNISRLENSKQR
jgi:hypothetical protein